MVDSVFKKENIPTLVIFLILKKKKNIVSNQAVVNCDGHTVHEDDVAGGGGWLVFFLGRQSSTLH